MTSHAGINQLPITHRLRSTVLNAALGFLLMAVLMAAVLLLMVLQRGVQVIGVSIVGGLAGLWISLSKPGNLSRLGYRFARLPRELSPYEQQSDVLIRKLRRRWVMGAASAPYFLVLVAYGVVNGPLTLPQRFGEGVVIALFSGVGVASIAWCAQWLDLLRSLQPRKR